MSEPDQLWRRTLAAVRLSRVELELGADRTPGLVDAGADRTRWSDEALDPSTGLGRTAAAVDDALQGFIPWTVGPQEAFALSRSSLGRGCMPPDLLAGRPGAWRMRWTFPCAVSGGAVRAVRCGEADAIDEGCRPVPDLRLFEGVFACFLGPRPTTMADVRAELRAVAGRVVPGAEASFAATGIEDAEWFELDGAVVGGGCTVATDTHRAGAWRLLLEPLAALREGRPVRVERQPSVQTVGADIAARYDVLLGSDGQAD